MKVLDLIHDLAEEQELEFLLIGGHAINAIGDRRQTRDIDLAVCEADRNLWKKLIMDMGYEIFNDTDVFLQFNPADIGQWPIDIIIIDKQTFAGLKAEARSINLDSENKILIPSANHLIVMKLHTLKQAGPIRKLKDLVDIVTLISHDKINVNSQEFQELCEKYGSKQVYKEIVGLCNEQ